MAFGSVSGIEHERPGTLTEGVWFDGRRPGISLTSLTAERGTVWHLVSTPPLQPQTLFESSTTLRQGKAERDVTKSSGPGFVWASREEGITRILTLRLHSPD